MGTAIRLTLTLCVVLAATPCAGQPPAPPETTPVSAPPEQYWLRVSGDHVLLRSRGDQNSPVVARLEGDAVLAAVGSEFGWHRVLPPEGVFCYVAAEFVDQVAPDQGIVSVRSGQLRVRVGSTVVDLDPARSEVQTRLPRGATVRIVGRQGEWLKIAPPPGVYLYIADALVERIGAEDAIRLRGPASPGAGPLAASATRPAAPPDLSSAWGQRLVLLETEIEAEGRRPAAEPSWPPFLERLRPIIDQREDPAVARLAQEWARRLAERIADQAALQAARAALEHEQRERARLDREMEQIRRARAGAESQPATLARGQLRESFAVRGESQRPRYKLQDPLTGRVVAYLEFEPQAGLEVSRFMGQYVGVRGQRTPTERLGADLIRVERIETLRWDPPASAPARKSP